MKTPVDFERLKSVAVAFGCPIPSLLAIDTAQEVQKRFDQAGIEFDRITPSVLGGVGLFKQRAGGLWSLSLYVEVHNSGAIWSIHDDKPVRHADPHEAVRYASDLVRREQLWHEGRSKGFGPHGYLA